MFMIWLECVHMNIVRAIMGRFFDFSLLYFCKVRDCLMVKIFTPKQRLFTKVKRILVIALNFFVNDSLDTYNIATSNSNYSGISLKRTPLGPQISVRFMELSTL